MSYSSEARARARAGAGPCHSRTLSSTLIHESVAAAAELVQKWHPDEKPNLFLFLHFGDDYDEEPSQFLGAIADLHRAMLFFASHNDDANNSGLIVQAQELLETAMSRLDIELRRLLLLHDDDDDDDHIQGQTQATIKRIVRAMMGAGYGKECLSTFKSSRRAMMAGKLKPLLLVAGPGQQGANNNYYSIIKNMMNKLGWDQVDAKIIQPWLAVASIAFRSLFPREKELCETVFDDAGHGVGEAVLAAIVKDHATGLLAVAEAAVARARRAPERLFRVLDIHHTLVQLQISNTAGDDHEQLVVARAAEAARATLLSFEAAILHSNNKATICSTPVHPLTRYVMNYLVFLADYEQLEEDMICRLVSSLVSKLDSKAGSYREAALSYLFLANNTHYVATKVQRSSKLQSILGEGWAEAHMAKARGHVQVYTRAVWGKVISSTSTSPESSKAAGGGVLTRLVMEAIQVQDQWMAADDDMANALRQAATAAVVPKYRMFYRRYGAAMSLTPGDVTAMIATLFTNASQPQDPNATPH